MIPAQARAAASGTKKGKGGQPTTYTTETAGLICGRIAEGESLRSICRDDKMPPMRTVFEWLSRNEEFSQQYARAREAQADAIFDEMLDIADDARNDWMERRGEEDAGWVANGEHIQRAKLRIDARKWMASKLQPKKYGDRLDLNHSGSIRDATDEAVESRLAKLLGKAGLAGDPRGEGTPEADE